MEVTQVFKIERETIAELAERFGLDIETQPRRPGDQRSFRLYKGANQIFFGTEEAARKFFVQYKSERPGLFSESLFGAKE